MHTERLTSAGTGVQMWKFAFHKQTYHLGVAFQSCKGQKGGIQDQKGFSTLTVGNHLELLENQDEIVGIIKEAMRAGPASHTKEKLDEETGKLQVITWQGASKRLAAWKEALDAQTVALDNIDDDGNMKKKTTHELLRERLLAQQEALDAAMAALRAADAGTAAPAPAGQQEALDTLLHVAAGQGHKFMVKELLRRGANPKVVNFGGKHLPLAPKCEHELAALLQQVKKNSANKGRWFISCGRSRGSRCNFFKLADETCYEAAVAKLKELKAQADDPMNVTEKQWNMNVFKNHVMRQKWSLDVQGNLTPTLREVVNNAASNFTATKWDQDIVHQKNGLGGEAYSVKLDHNWRVTCAVVTGECGNPVLVAHVFMSDHSDTTAQIEEYTCVIGARNTDDKGQKINPPEYRVQDPDP